ncbi:baseplate protein [Pararheinheimera phage vB_PsoM_KLER1-1]|nr:baseplate protein [Pararheinheimera phage vB_PsoM_KLER1-1]
MIGTFGPVTFTSSSNRVRTFKDLKRSKSHRFAEHNVVTGKPKLESIAPGLDTVTFNMRFDLGLGVNPVDELRLLSDIVESGEAYTLMVGNEVIGTFAIKQMDESRDRHDGSGILIVASADLQLQEYVE